MRNLWAFAGLLGMVFTAGAQTDALPPARDGLVVGVEGRFAQTWDHGMVRILQSQSQETSCSECASVDGVSGTTWTTGVSIGYRFEESDLLQHGPFLLFQWLGRNLFGTTDGDVLPTLDHEGNVVNTRVYHEIVTTTQHIASSVGYGVSYANIRLDASIGVLSALWVSGEEYMRLDGPGVFDPSLPIEGEFVDNGRGILIEHFDRDDINANQVIAQVSLTYGLEFDQWSVAIGPYYGHTFSSTLTRASGSNLSIDDLGGVLTVQYRL